jgi:hypothetical protein
MKSIFLTIVTVLTLALLLSLPQCRKENSVPSCIEKVINKIKSENVRNPPGSVWQYEYNDQTVYYIPPYCCDVPSQLFDENCNLICNPDGGFFGGGDGKCTDFFIKRKNGKLIWQDDRK